MDALRARIRAAFEVRANETNYQKASQSLGRNKAYIYQFIFKGTPKKLDTDDRMKLAAHLRVDPNSFEPLYDDPNSDEPMPVGFNMADFAPIPAYDIKASAGHGAVVQHEAILHYVCFRKQWLKSISNAPFNMLGVIGVDGDSMEPTLSHGDSVLVDLTQNMPHRDGIYAVLYDSVLLVKRLRLDPVRGTITIMSDNEAYPPVENVVADEIKVAGRVVWGAGKL